MKETRSPIGETRFDEFERNDASRRQEWAKHNQKYLLYFKRFPGYETPTQQDLDKWTEENPDTTIKNLSALKGKHTEFIKKGII